MFKASARPLQLFTILLALTLLVPVVISAKTADSTVVKGIVNKAIELMDRNLGAQAMKQWDSVIVLVPDYTPYKYERSLCLVMEKRYQEAVTALEPIYQDTMLYDRGYQLMGNCYDYLDQPDRSHEFYAAGLKKYPTSGRLHYEMGAAAFLRNRKDSAVDWWIRGTRVEPWFATNYYWVAKGASTTKNKIWTVFFGEMFVNLEPNTQRTKEVGQLVYNAWNASMQLGDTNDPINFCSDELLEAPSSFGPATMNFPTAFEFTVAQSSQHFIPDTGVRAKLSIGQLVDVRKKFLDGWKGAGYLKKYPNDLIDWNMKLKEAGWLEEYLWWVLGYGDMDEARGFIATSKRYDDFFGWLMNNQLVPDHPLCLGAHCSDK